MHGGAGESETWTWTRWKSLARLYDTIRCACTVRYIEVVARKVVKPFVNLIGCLLPDGFAPSLVSLFHILPSRYLRAAPLAAGGHCWIG